MPLTHPHHARAAPGPEGRGLERALIVLMAVTTGAAVANIYYIQPLLHLVGDGFGVSDTVAGILVTCAQLGYLLGLAFLVPLGDLRERRRLIVVVMMGVVLALALCAAAPDFSVLAVALIAVGALSVVAQILVPLAATLARPEERGRVVGTVMSGLLIGILSARIFSGLIAELGGFRLVFGLAAGLMALLTLLLYRALPRVGASQPMPYRRALRSIFDLIGEEPVLRQRMGLAVLQMVGFLILWTSIAFLLSGEPYDYGEAVIGLFGLAGIAGALIAPVVGRLSDRGSGRLAMTLSLAAVLVSWAPLAAGGSSLIALIAGIVLLDLGIQGQQIANQSAIYALRPEARNRLNTAYMVSLFVGGVLGSLLASGVYGAAGWEGICVLGAVVAAAGLVLWGVTERAVARPRAARSTAPPRGSAAHPPAEPQPPA
jgi:predicted MFS family arabinose efflux permease